MSQSRRDFLALSAVGVVAGAFGRPTLARAWQQQPAPITPVFTPIRGNVGYFTANGGTIGYLINSGGVAVIDTQFMNTAQMCIDGLQERSKNHGVDILFNTHHHGDHTGGNLAFKGLAKKHVANKRAAELQQSTYEAAVKRYEDAMKAPASATPPKQPPTKPADILVADRTFTDTWSETLGDEKLTAKTYTPAHTSGDAVMFFEKANVVHMGDLLFNRRHPVVDRPAGASLANWIKMVENVAKDQNKDTVFIAGHAGAKFPVVCAQADLMLMRDYITALLGFVNAQIKAGKTREDVIAMKDVLKGFDDHGPLTAAPLTAAFDELTAK